MTELERALKQMGLTQHDIMKHVKNGADLLDWNSFVDSIEGGLMDFEETFGETKEEMKKRFDDADKNIRNFVADTDLVILDGEKFLIVYCLQEVE